MCEIPKDFPTIIASEERFILPSSELSNSADELEVVHLPGYDLWMTFIKNIHVIPTQLNVEKFCSALSKTMSMYLHTSGRLEHSVREGWAIKMTHSAVPLSIRVTSDLTCYQNRSECVVRDDLGFLHAPRPDRLLVESGQAPLLLVAITIAQEESAIAISWHHTLGTSL
ncbi:hypothetical protein BDQ12DRAFT_293930 [Crucibulum laeve]|uniref:Uncharacterized protein n=1 Tax=Crucibulum laeve TaxID=68775 RepID=A0A5C3MNQ7_9AGAR|nr:hypothetical protein BDQ12DRAFT_293930 [Crucibulum laeve]